MLVGDAVLIKGKGIETPADGKSIIYNESTGMWENYTPSGGGSISHDDLTDVDTTNHHSNANDPTSDEKAALAGTGTPSGTNKYVTNDDSRLTDDRDPTAHASDHATGGADEIDGDLLDVDYTPVNYTPAAATLVGHLTPIDTLLGTIGGGGAHAATHVNGTDDVDGDKLDIDFTPVNYTPDASPAEADDTDDLAAHLKGIDTELGNTTADVSDLENNVVAAHWDIDSTDYQYSDVAIDVFTDQTNVDLAASTGEVYDADNDFYKHTQAASGQSTSADVTAESDVDIENLFSGDTVYWQATSGTTQGYFSSDSGGSTRLTIKDVATDYPDVQEGIRIVHAGGESVILEVTNDGDQDDEVRIDTGITDATVITGAYGLEYDSGAIAVNQLVTDTATACTQSLDENNPNTTGYSLRTIVPTAQIAGRGDKVRVTFKAHPSSSFNADNVSIGIHDSAGSTISTPVELLFSTASGFSLTAGQTITSDWLDFSFEETDDLVIICDYGDSAGFRNYGTETWGDTYYKAASNSYNVADISGLSYSHQTGYVDLFTTIETQEVVTGADLYVATTNSNTQIDTSNWASIDDITVTATQPGSSTTWYAVSGNKGDSDESWEVYLASAWRSIARLNTGTWQYQDAGDAWQNATVNSRLGALSQAFGITANQLSETALEAIASNFSTWFSAGTLDFAFGLQEDSEDVPAIDVIAVEYTLAQTELSLVMDSWEASANDPDDAYCVLEVEEVGTRTMGTHYQAFVSMDDGSNYEELTLSLIKTIGSIKHIRGDKTSLTARTDKTMRLKVTTSSSDGSNYTKFYAAALGVKYA